MRTIILSLGLVLSTSAFAATAKGTNGNYRRAEALDAVGAKSGRVVSVDGTSLNKVHGAKALPKDSHVLMVDHGGKVDLVVAPLDKSKAVTPMTKRQIEKAGFITQSQAKELAERNGGALGSKGKVTVVNDGVASSGGSYNFKQTAPKSLILKGADGSKQRVSSINRTVPLTGEGGESATGAYSIVK
jgi:hypothetical protein